MWPYSQAARTATQPLQIATRIIVPASPTLRRAMSINSAPNASGLIPTRSRALPERQAEASEEKAISAIKDLYSCKPQRNTYDAYTKEAAFQDPIGIAEGVDSIAAQFNGLAKLFPRADIPKFRILKNPGGLPPGTLLIDQDVAYYRDPASSTPTKTLNSLLTIFTNEEHQITRHVEEWDHLRDANKDDGFFGTINEYRKKITASIVDKVVDSDPKDDKN